MIASLQQRFHISILVLGITSRKEWYDADTTPVDHYMGGRSRRHDDEARAQLCQTWYTSLAMVVPPLGQDSRGKMQRFQLEGATRGRLKPGSLLLSESATGG